jgi:2-amino-4-hydroxy-6-hydroxymethyldihydropteridine diphosphokinase
MNRVYLHTGSNLGQREANLQLANKLITKEIGAIRQASRLYSTAAWGIEDQPDFLNQALEVGTTLRPGQVLEAIGRIEQQMGRIRIVKWGQRLIDIDILFYNHLVINRADLKIPHPELQNRNFVLAPLLEIAPGLKHPIFQKTIRELASICGDTLNANLYREKESEKPGHA